MFGFERGKIFGQHAALITFVVSLVISSMYIYLLADGVSRAPDAVMVDEAMVVVWSVQDGLGLVTFGCMRVTTGFLVGKVEVTTRGVEIGTS